jgi:hypothetical protein
MEKWLDAFYDARPNENSGPAIVLDLRLVGDCPRASALGQWSLPGTTHDGGEIAWEVRGVKALTTTTSSWRTACPELAWLLEDLQDV